jgi:beta-1,4-mannosyltransferase
MGDPKGRVIRVLASPAESGTDGNPYVSLLYQGMADRSIRVEPFNRRLLLTRPDVVHVHWPAYLVDWTRPLGASLAAAKVLALLWISRRRGTRLIWTAHDLEPHDLLRPRLQLLYMSVFMRLVDHVILLSPGAETLVKRRWPTLEDTPTTVIPHGHYLDAYPDTAVHRAEYRTMLSVPPDEPLALILGQVRPYKNLPALLRARDPSHPHVIVVGEPKPPELGRELSQLAQLSPALHLVLRRVDPDEVTAWHAAADVVVLPYASPSVLNSGAAILALSLGVPVVARMTPVMSDLRSVVGSDWMSLVEGSPAAFLEQATRLSSGARDSRPDLRSMAWPDIRARTSALYAALSKPKRGRGRGTH